MEGINARFENKDIINKYSLEGGLNHKEQPELNTLSTDEQTTLLENNNTLVKHITQIDKGTETPELHVTQEHTIKSLHELSKTLGTFGIGEGSNGGESSKGAPTGGALSDGEPSGLGDDNIDFRR